MNRVYILAGVVALAGIALWRTYAMGYSAGADAVTVAYAASMAAAQANEQETVKEVIKWKIKREVVYRDRIKEIKVAADPTGCLDTGLVDLGLGWLLRTDSDSSGSETDDARGGAPVD